VLLVPPVGGLIILLVLELGMSSTSMPDPWLPILALPSARICSLELVKFSYLGAVLALFAGTIYYSVLSYLLLDGVKPPPNKARFLAATSMSLEARFESLLDWFRPSSP